ncbi:hypothetical protein Y032_0038g3646 [Ancylostoma ceylanicum]|uniref:Uncharacterized protein n=1 Tax=Ancylostoma ceylanicum TaxID=53326 RepID=A0A016UKW1_9BILA|nr:hypothetical protein Y032_0038g3646 [Ancylostoma ceylanicum]
MPTVPTGSGFVRSIFAAEMRMVVTVSGIFLVVVQISSLPLVRSSKSKLKKRVSQAGSRNQAALKLQWKSKQTRIKRSLDIGVFVNQLVRFLLPCCNESFSRFCSEDDGGIKLQSHTNLVPIIAYSRDSFTFMARLKYHHGTLFLIRSLSPKNLGISQ